MTQVSMLRWRPVNLTRLTSPAVTRSWLKPSVKCVSGRQTSTGQYELSAPTLSSVVPWK